MKKQDYDLSSDAGRISLAQDVARLANVEQGGIVLVGMAGKKIHGEEVLSQVRPIPKNPQGVRRHRQAIDTRLFPRVDDLSVEQIDLDDSAAIIAVHIPPVRRTQAVPCPRCNSRRQDPRLLISIVRRQGEASIPVSPTAIHAAFAAGRNLLRQGPYRSNRRQSVAQRLPVVASSRLDPSLVSNEFRHNRRVCGI